MKRLLTILLLIILSSSIVGCTREKENSEDNNEVSTEENNVNSKLSSEEITKFYNEKLPEVKEFFIENNRDFEEIQYEGAADYAGISHIRLTDSDLKEGTFKSAYYGIHFNDNKPERIIASMSLNVDKQKIKVNGFKFDSTAFGKFTGILIKDDIDLNSINSEINSYYNGNGMGIIEFQENQTRGSIIMTDDSIKIIISIYS